MNTQKINSNFRTLQNVIFTCTVEPLCWPKVIFAEKRLSQKTKKTSFLEPPKSPKHLYMKHLGASRNSAKQPKTDPEARPKETLVRRPIRIVNSAQVLYIQCFERFRAVRSCSFSSENRTYRSTKKGFLETQKSAEMLIYTASGRSSEFPRENFRFTNLGRFLDPPSGPESAQSSVCIAFGAFSESPKVDPSRTEKMRSTPK